jgi:hypothetical protein
MPRTPRRLKSEECVALEEGIAKLKAVSFTPEG